MHRVIMGLEVGHPLEVHHRNSIRNDNRRQNLEVVTRQQNEQYKHRKPHPRKGTELVPNRNVPFVGNPGNVGNLNHLE